jgi:release factor glutamine methyltransferase
MNDAPSGPPTGRSSSPGSGLPPALASSVARLRAAGCVFAEEEAELLHEAAAGSDRLDALLRRREAGEPLEQILGWVAFRGLRVPVSPGVFVPRRRTEAVVDAALALLDGRGPATVLDLCCGVGAIGRALLEERDGLTLHAADLSPAAVACARRTLAGLATVHRGDLFAALPEDLRGRIDLVVVNAPYVPTAAIALMAPEARLHEPASTLDGGGDGLALHRRIAAEVLPWLSDDGAVVIETSREQAERTAALFADAGFDPSIVLDDDLDATVVSAPRQRTTRV